MPVCLDVTDDRIDLQSGLFGKVAGFGKTVYGTASSILQSVTLPYVPLPQCRSASRDYDTGKYITYDKFCAGYTNG